MVGKKCTIDREQESTWFLRPMDSVQRAYCTYILPEARLIGLPDQRFAPTADSGVYPAQTRGRADPLSVTFLRVIGHHLPARN